MMFNIGPFGYRLRIVRNLVDDHGRKLSGRSFADPAEIHLAAELAPSSRFEVLLMELKHVWCFHVPIPREPEEEWDLHVMIVRSLQQDLERIGGLAAIESLAPDPADDADSEGRAVA
jgi:hypothetical protein